MAFNLVLNSNNSIDNTTYQFDFKENFTIHEDAEICISNIQFPYSWFNITQKYNNNFFEYVWLGVGYPVAIPDGFYTVTDINAFLQQTMILNNHYLINSSGNYVYYLTLLYNQATYGVQIIASLIPTSLPTGYTAPPGFVFPATTQCPQFIVENDNNFGIIIGFVFGFYPSVNTSNASILNTLTPLGTNVNSLIVRCSLVDNQVGVPTDILDTFPITSTFGSNINYAPPFPKWVKLSAGSFQYIIIKFVDQNFNSIDSLDNNVCISLLINNKKSIL
jgi:hypothetical protein